MTKRKRKSNIREWAEAIIIALLLVLVTRVFIIDIFIIPTTSMEKTILPGDFILVSKLSYGPRIPITPFSMPFSHQSLPFTKSTNSYIDVQLPYTRIPGFSEISRNDVVLFNYPMNSNHPVDQRTYFTKRCVALPGDSLMITDKKVMVNGNELPFPDNVQFNYRVKADSGALNDDTLRMLGINEGGRTSHDGNWQLTLTEEAVAKLEQMPGVKEIIAMDDTNNTFNEYIFPANEHFPWNRDNYGPIQIPAKGDSVNLTLANLPLYYRIISEYEENELQITDSSIIINGKPQDFYTFCMDYYFMLGDNRHNSADSRFWGFVPEDHIVGKPVCVIFSVDKGAEGFFSKMRWSRIFKGIE